MKFLSLSIVLAVTAILVPVLASPIGDAGAEVFGTLEKRCSCTPGGKTCIQMGCGGTCVNGIVSDGSSKLKFTAFCATS